MSERTDAAGDGPSESASLFDRVSDVVAMLWEAAHGFHEGHSQVESIRRRRNDGEAKADPRAGDAASDSDGPEPTDDEDDSEPTDDEDDPDPADDEDGDTGA